MSPSATARDRSRSPVSAPAAARQEPLKGLKALLLGLGRRPDRRARAETMLAREAPWLDVEFFSATDGKATVIPETEVTQTWNTKNNSCYYDYEDLLGTDGKVIHTAEEFRDPGVEYKLSPGERGCAHSHLLMWKRAAEGSVPVLILEDDVQLNFVREDGTTADGQAFTQRLELAMVEATQKNADVLYLGWSGFRENNFRHRDEPEVPSGAVIRKAEYVWTTVAYVLWPHGARQLLQAGTINQPVDNFMAWECSEGRLNSYVVVDFCDADETWSGGIAGQVDFQGDSDIHKSDGGDQGDDPTACLVAAAPVTKVSDMAAQAPALSASLAANGA